MDPEDSSVFFRKSGHAPTSPPVLLNTYGIGTPHHKDDDDYATFLRLGREHKLESRFSDFEVILSWTRHTWILAKTTP
ncbi:hypothetical protein PV04_05188 [Phialophora macrospora]|uniref:Uncharacterized protein n=1 Tax=Phialophora macrospora TaxID=1851006 RepID=A0A0D2E4M6_9EURO|nr:hypothetical protein PV04_05188 [Phialophora macrospora]